MYLGATTPAVRKRQNIERRIVLSLIDELLKHGFVLAVDDGEGMGPRLTEREPIVNAIMNTDEDVLFAFKGEFKGWVKLVYGNDGWDVISDYTTNLTPFMTATEALAEAIESRE